MGIDLGTWIDIGRAVIWVVWTVIRAPRRARDILTDCRRFGIKKAMQRRELSTRVPLIDFIDAADSEVLFVGIDFGSLVQFDEIIREKAQRYGIRVLMPDPRDEPLMRVIRAFFKRDVDVYGKFVTALRTFKALHNSVDSARFRVGLHHVVPSYSAVFVDDHAATIEFYSYGQPMEQRLAIELRDGELLREYRASCYDLFEASEKLTSDAQYAEAIEAARKLSEGPS